MDKKRLKNRMRQFKRHYFEIRVEYILCTIVCLARLHIAAPFFSIGRLSTFSYWLPVFVFNRWRSNLLVSFSSFEPIKLICFIATHLTLVNIQWRLSIRWNE